ncbi:outer membrane protein assembly factor [Polymorphobacter glacialis]|uniref:Outer membrane protein assembly factor n=1 Tax=Sandarakinorhabdus glacialis TaxID=1614636 RepID=A0A916ZHQ1_9SPHN|nr:outer membrane protein assembly factor [Polymorphobacter glacialis]
MLVSGVVLLAGAARAQDTTPVAAAPPDAGPVPMPQGAPQLEDFAPLPGNVAWPTVETTTDGEPVEVAGDVSYMVAVTGLAELGLETQFRELSSLWTKRGQPANLAQINRRTTEDRDLIDQLLRSIGHYGGNTAVALTAPVQVGGKTSIAMTVTAGPIYTFDSISVVAPAEAIGGDPLGIVKPLLGIKVGDTVDAARVNAGQDAIAVKLADAGYAFAVVGKPDIVIDHATRTATLLQTIDLGKPGVHGALRMSGALQGFDDKHLALLARFKPGDPFTDAGRDDLRRALIHTGLFGTVSVRPVAGAIQADGTQVVDLQITTEAAPARTIAASVGYSTGQGIRVEGSWTHRNLFQPEGAFTARVVAAEREQVLTGEIRKRNFRRRDQSLTLRGGFTAEQQDAFDATTVGVLAAIDRESNIIWQKPITYSVGVELLATRQRDRSAPDDPNNTYFILAFPGAITWDRSDDLLNPSKGFRLSGRVSPEFSLRSGQNFNYVKLQVDGSVYQPFGDFVLAGRMHVGGIAGAERGRIAPDRRFYAGGGGSVRGYDYQGVGPQDAEGSPTGGNSLVEASAEVRYRFEAFGSDLGVVGFVDAGQVYPTSLPKFTDLRYGVGIGLRYFTSFGPVRIDIATPIARREGEPRAAFYVSIGQAF